MKLFNFSVIIGIVILFVVNGHAMSMPVKNIQSAQKFEICSTPLDINSHVEVEIVEFLDNDDDESEQDIKMCSALDSIIISLRFEFNSIFRKTNIVPKEQLPLLYKSWQSYLQVFRL